jgi:hypothetical protein
MSHIFISYAHADKTHLDTVLSWLKDNKFSDSEIWFDNHINGGSNWRDEISDALDEAFAMLFIITKSSVNSLYCTYEWAYAMGQGMPILPLVFDNLVVAQLPAPLSAKQFITCVDGIPEFLGLQVHQLKSTPPEVAAINQLIYEAINDTHRRFFILGWAGESLLWLGGEDNKEMLIYFLKEAAKARQTLQNLMLEKAFALSGRQYRYCWKLVDKLKRLAHIQTGYEEHLPKRFFEDFETEWLPAFEYFERDGWWSKAVRKYFDFVLNDERYKMEVIAEMTRVFPHFHVQDADLLIHNKIVEHKRATESDSDSKTP